MVQGFAQDEHSSDATFATGRELSPQSTYSASCGSERAGRVQNRMQRRCICMEECMTMYLWNSHSVDLRSRKLWYANEGRDCQLSQEKCMQLVLRRLSIQESKPVKTKMHV
mmetsp:Transcript_20607/g.29886  ORF Transcript_20607/g.29886 Transcript_20607/m.29886 type:complete len:111 (+) Transcript_20607:216-548(+)